MYDSVEGDWFLEPRQRFRDFQLFDEPDQIGPYFRRMKQDDEEFESEDALSESEDDSSESEEEQFEIDEEQSEIDEEQYSIHYQKK